MSLTKRGDGRELLTGGNEVDIDGADAGGLVDESKGNLTRGRRLGLVVERELVEAGGYVADEDGVLT